MPVMYRVNPDTGEVEGRYFSPGQIAAAYFDGWSRARPKPTLPMFDTGIGFGARETGGPPSFGGVADARVRAGRTQVRGRGAPPFSLPGLGSTGGIAPAAGPPSFGGVATVPTSSPSTVGLRAAMAAAGIEATEQVALNTTLPADWARGGPVTLYRLNQFGTEEQRVVADRAELPVALGEGWSPYRPTPTPQLRLNAEGIPYGVIGDTGMGIQGAVALYYLNYLNSQPGTLTMRPRIVSVKPSDSHSPTGAPRYIVEWAMQGSDPAVLGSGGDVTIFGGGPESDPSRLSGTFMDEVSLFPDEKMPGRFMVMPSHMEPAMYLPEMASDIVSGDRDPQNVLENDTRVANVFARMRDGTMTRAEGYWQLTSMVGSQAAKLLDDTAQLMVEADLGIMAGTLPRFSEETPVGLLGSRTSPIDAPIWQVLADAESETSGALVTAAEMYERNMLGPNTFNVPIDPSVIVPPNNEANLSREALRPLGPGEYYSVDAVTGIWSIKTWGSNQQFQPPTEESLLTDMFALLQAAMSGGGGPTYQAPDPNQVRDEVKAMLIALTGRPNNARVEMLTDIYFRADRQRFDGASVDPGQAVKDKIRSFDDYKRIHTLRPDMVDEMDWLAYQNQGLMQGGMRTGAVERRAITQALVGTAPARAAEAGMLSEFSATGRPNMPAFFDRLKTTLASLSRLVS